MLPLSLRPAAPSFGLRLRAKTPAWVGGRERKIPPRTFEEAAEGVQLLPSQLSR